MAVFLSSGLGRQSIEVIICFTAALLVVWLKEEEQVDKTDSGENKEEKGLETESAIT